MGGFDSIIGQDAIKEHLKTTIKLNKISHAYLIVGEQSSGKEYIARIFANACVCENLKDGYEPCLKCHSCIQAMTKSHPDIITLTKTKQNANTISVDDIREQIVSDALIRPYMGGKKIYIINEADKMTPQAQNALLKTLEEPPEYIVILLLASNESAILDTIMSRCVKLSMKPVEDKLVRSFLMKEVKIPDYQADICVAFARGNIGKAKNLASSEDFDNIKNEAVRTLRYIRQMDVADLLDTIKMLLSYKVNIDDFLDIMMIWYRDVLLYKATMDADAVIFKEEGDSIRKYAQESSYEGIEEIIKAIDKTKQRLKANVNFELAMELLLMTIKEN